MPRVARGLERKKQERQMLNANVKNRTFSACQIYRPRGMPSGAHALHALTAGEAFTHWQEGPTTTTAVA
jgi:hypothetical protein